MNIEKLKQARIEKKLSYDDLAKKTGYSRSTITNIFCGYIEQPRYETIISIEQALGLTANFSAPAEVLSDEERKLINYFRVLNPSMRAYVMQMAKNAVLIKTVENEDKGVKNNEQQNG